MSQIMNQNYLYQLLSEKTAILLIHLGQKNGCFSVFLQEAVRYTLVRENLQIYSYLTLLP